MRKAGDIVLELFRERFGEQFMEKGRSTTGLFSSWSKIVTEVCIRMERKKAFASETEPDEIPAAAVHSRIKEIEHGVLFVEADHPGWIQILQTRQTELLKEVSRRFPELGIRTIAFKLCREPFARK